MSQKTTLLLVARDMATANNYAPVIKLLRQNPRVDLHVLAQKPAFDLFQREGLNPVEVTQTDALSLRKFCLERLEALHPALVLAGNSTKQENRESIDDAMLKLADVPCLIFQDWPGVISDYARKGRRHFYLCADSIGVESTYDAGYNAFFVGAPAYDSYAKKDYMDLRYQFRQAYPEKKIIGFSGQYLTEHLEYLDLIETLAAAVADRNKKGDNLHLVYRPHPAEKTRGMRDVEKTSAIFARHLAGNWSLDENVGQDAMLAGSDVVVAYSSTSLYDLAMMNRHAPIALAVPVAMLWDRNLNQRLGVEGYKRLKSGLGYVVTDPFQFPSVLYRALKNETLQAVWDATRGQNQSSPAAVNIMRVIDATLGWPLSMPRPMLRSGLSLTL